MRDLDQLLDQSEPAIALLRDWLASSKVEAEMLAPSSARSEVLVGLQVTTRSPLGALAYETGGLLLDGGWVRFLGSGSPQLTRDLLSWNEGRSRHFFLVGDDAAGGFFAVNGGGLGPEVNEVYYWAPDDLEWEPLGMGFTGLLQSLLGGSIDKFYESLRWPSWRVDVSSISADECFAFYPFLWTREGSLSESHRGKVPVAEAFDMKVSMVEQLGDGA